MVRKTRFLLVILAAVLAGIPGIASFSAQAQDQARSSRAPEISAIVSPDSIQIGDHFRIEVQVTKDQMQVIDFPRFEKGEKGEKIELLQSGPVDTLKREGRSITLRKTYTMTCFDEGAYNLGRVPMLYVDKNITDTIWSKDSLRLRVYTIPVDTLTQTIYDIKKPLRTPLRFGEFGGYLLIGVLIIALLAVLIWYLVKRLKNRPVFSRPAIQEPAHVTAIRELEKLHAQKLWQSGKHKPYYTGITDILRGYLDGRYGVKAMEMTSDEILDGIRTLNLPPADVSLLTEMLRTADLVKFAKHIPGGDENEMIYHHAYSFIEDTKDMTAVTTETAESEPEEQATGSGNDDQSPTGEAPTNTNRGKEGAQ